MYHSKEPDFVSAELLTAAEKLLLGSSWCYLFFRMSKSQCLSLFSQGNFSIPDQFKVSLPSLIQFVSGFPGRDGDGGIKTGCSTKMVSHKCQVEQKSSQCAGCTPVNTVQDAVCCPFWQPGHTAGSYSFSVGQGFQVPSSRAAPRLVGMSLCCCTGAPQGQNFSFFTYLVTLLSITSSKSLITLFTGYVILVLHVSPASPIYHCPLRPIINTIFYPSYCLAIQTLQ